MKLALIRFHFLPLVLSAVLALEIHEAQSSQLSCTADLEKVANADIEKSLSIYRHLATRGGKDYTGILGARYADALAKLAADSVVLDLGAGFGLAAYESSVLHPGKFIAVNAQDFWQQLLNTPQPLEVANQLRKVVNTLGIHVPDDILDLSVPLQWKKIQGMVREKFQQIQMGGKFRYEAAKAEDYLLTLADNSVDLMPGVYGAWFYSSPRHQLLDLMYLKLKKGGQAFILLQEETERLPFVKGPVERFAFKSAWDQHEITFTSYLLSTFPDVFSIEKNVLIMRKKTRDRLQLRERLRVKSTHDAFFDAETNLYPATYEPSPFWEGP